MKSINVFCSVIVATLILVGCGNSSQKKENKIEISDDEIIQLYDYAMTRFLVARQEVIDIAGDFEYNKIVYNELGKATFANPNLDVAYNEAWVAIDEKNPVIIEVPQIEGRYYTAQFLDEWNETFVNINPKYFDKAYGKFALCLEGVEYDLPDDVTRIDMYSKKAHLLARVELKTDPEVAVKLQNEFKMYVLNDGQPEIEKETLKVFPLDKLMGGELFELANQYFAPKDPMPNAPKYQEKILTIAEQMAADPEFKKRVDEVCKSKGAAFVLESVRKYGVVKNGWGKTDVIGVYDNDYNSRTVVSLIGIWANTTKECIYFTGNIGSDGKQLSGDNSYELRFAKDALPMNNAQYFWSVILVDAVDYFVVQNPLNHFNFNNYMGLENEKNGDLVIFCGPKLLDGYNASNWLPTPTGKNFSLTARFYGPQGDLVEGKWHMPEIRKINN